MKIFLIVILLIIFFTESTMANNKQFKSAPVNPKLVKYLQQEKNGALKKLSAEGYPLGYIPHSVIYHYADVVSMKKSADFPVVYDLRDINALTPVKDQSTCGACWTFATYGSIESRWLLLGAGEYDLSEQNLKNGSGFEINACDGGNASIATAYLVRGDGPVSEEDDPYDVDSDEYVTGLTPMGYVSDARFLPNDINVIKENLINYGAIYTTMYWDDQYYDGNNYTYYCDVDSSSNHAVLIVGWNDTLQTAGGQGAWIIRNSWSGAFADSGFFYISYNDICINSELSVWPNRMDYNEDIIIHQYDKLGLLNTIGCNQNTGFGLVKFSIDSSQNITKLGTWVSSGKATVSFEIYDNFSNGNLSDPLAAIQPQQCDYPGYYTFDLSSPLRIDSGDTIYIKVGYQDYNSSYPIPVEGRIQDYALPEIEEGKCWASCDGNQWTAIGENTNLEYDLCIKAYGVTRVTAVEEDGETFVPKSFMIRNYPNPFNPSTTIHYTIPERGIVNITVYDTQGRVVKEVVNGIKNAGEYRVRFNGEGLSSGVYFYRLKSGRHIEVKKMVYIR